MKVAIVNNAGPAYTAMFKRKGWEVVDSIDEADLVQFIGGADVSPSYYGQHSHSLTHCDSKRDEIEKLMFLLALKLKKPMAGICRGGQFLNVMNGGSLWQDVRGHRGTHAATYTDFKNKKELMVTSTHHQMMIPPMRGNDATVLMVAKLGKARTKCAPLHQNYRSITVSASNVDTEAVYYEKNNCLCFQPHPEFEDKGKLSDLYFFYIDTLLMVEDD